MLVAFGGKCEIRDREIRVHRGKESKIKNQKKKNNR